MVKRNSFVDNIVINDIVHGSIVQIGDSSQINAIAKVFALQREQELFYGIESEYDNFGNFTEPIPIPPILEKINFNIYNAEPSIHVPFVRIIGMSASAIFHVGSTNDVYLEARVHHTRQLKNR
ncbi:spore germination protein GerPE [Heyndrickxia sp. NPDC080065]|uniref:spore germination protein GerPE n=1 Tax=Heyndrickxia sp. NPDC080065 TaxID=3390568 RepID=UPI003D039B96